MHSISNARTSFICGYYPCSNCPRSDCWCVPAGESRSGTDSRPDVAVLLGAHTRLDVDAQPAVSPRPAASHRPDLCALCPDRGRSSRERIPSRVRSSGQAVATEWAQKRVCRAFRQRGVIPLHARTPRRVVRRSRSHSVRFCRRGSAPIWRHRVLAPAPDFSATAVRARQTDSRQAVAHCVRKPVTRSLRAMVAPLRPYPTRSRGAQSASTRLGNHTLP